MHSHTNSENGEKELVKSLTNSENGEKELVKSFTNSENEEKELLKSGRSSALEFVSSPDDDTINKLTAQLELVEKQRRQVYTQIFIFFLQKITIYIMSALIRVGGGDREIRDCLGIWRLVPCPVIRPCCPRLRKPTSFVTIKTNNEWNGWSSCEWWENTSWNFHDIEYIGSSQVWKLCKALPK